MTILLIIALWVIGLLAWAIGLAVYPGAKSAIQEIEALGFVMVGTLSIIGAVIAGAVVSAERQICRRLDQLTGAAPAVPRPTPVPLTEPIRPRA